MNNREKINSLQSLRALAFIGIFLQHAGAEHIKWSSLGVSVFFVLSGFLLVISNYEREDTVLSFLTNFKYSCRKVKNIYPLHIITMVLCLLLDILAIIRKWSVGRALTLLGETALNIPLLQSWYPKHSVNVSLNGVAWYLSVSRKFTSDESL